MANLDQPGPSSAFNLSCNWFHLFSEKLSACNVDKEGKAWILSNFAHWENLEELDKCEDLSPKKLGFVKNELAAEFLDFLEQKRAFKKIIDSLELKLNKVLEEQLIISFGNGYGELWRFIGSDEFLRTVSKEKVESLTATLENVRPANFQPSISKAVDENLHFLMNQLHDTLKAENIKQEAIEEIMQNIGHFDELKECLENCEELSKKEVRNLSQKLLDLFNKIKRIECPKQFGSSNDIIQSLLDSLQLSPDAIQWTTQWLQTGALKNLNLDELDACDDLSRKQCQSIKSKLRELNDSQSSKSVPASDIFLEQVDYALKSRPNIKTHVCSWVLENICSMKSLNELHKCADLSKIEIEFLKSALNLHFRAFRCKEPGFFSDLAFDADQGYSQSAPRLFNNSPEVCNSFTITPLIQIRKQMQGEKSIEKFCVSEEGINGICNQVPEDLTDEVPVYYKSQSNGTIIDFETLNDINFKCIGLFGPLEAVVQSLTSVISAELLSDFQEKFTELVPGLYLLDLTRLTIKFIVFRAEEEIDFATVEKESRAVHLLRYMTQLVNNTVLCLDGKYEDRLANERQTSHFKSDRRSCFTLETQKLQDETFKLISTGDIALGDLKCDYFSSNDALLAVSVTRYESETKDCVESEIGGVSELKEFVNVLEVRHPDEICEEFKSELLKTFHETLFNGIDSEIERHMRNIKERIVEETRQLVLDSTVLYLIMRETRESWEWSVVKRYFVRNSDKTNGLWYKKIHLIHDNIKAMLSKEAETTALKAIREHSIVKEQLVKNLLWWYLHGSDSKASKQSRKPSFYEIDINELMKSAENKMRLDPDFPPGFRDSCPLLKTLSSHYFSLNTSEEIDSCTVNYVNYCHRVVERYKNTPRFWAFCLTKSNEAIEKLSRQMTVNLISQKFNELYVDNRKSEDCSKNDYIKSIRLYEDQSNHTMKFKMLNNLKKVVESRNQLSIFQLAPTLNSKQKLTIHETTFDPRNLEWVELGTLESSSHDQLFAICVLNSSKFLAMFNEEKTSRLSIHDFEGTGKKPYTMYFGKIICSYDIDTKSRILILQSESEPGVVQAVQFCEGFRDGAFLPPIDLGKLLMIEATVPFCFQRNSKKNFWFLYDGTLRKIDLKESKLSGKTVRLDAHHEQSKLFSTPDGAAVLVSSTDGRIIPVMTETGKIMEEVSYGYQQRHVVELCNVPLLIDINDSKIIFSLISTFAGAQSETQLKLRKKVSEQQSCDNKRKVHWMNLLYWMYTKFPSEDLLSKNPTETHLWFLVLNTSNNYQQKLKSEIKSIQKRLSNTCKPLSEVKFHKEKFCDRLTELNTRYFEDIFMGCFVQKLITFVPLQIARCQSNEFHVLANNDSVDFEAVNHVFDFADQINFGFYDSIFNAWTGDIKVISSMGKQSTGKSYTLNHLTGSSFNIAGVRCTHGCWMTVKQTEDCLYVILDFEGLGTFERTEQEDMLLSLFNSSVASITLFKTEKRLDRDIDKLFNKMNLGSDQLKASNQCFKGKFMIVINDIAEQDVGDTPSEFVEKIRTIVSRSEKNFIKKLYNSDFEIMAFPAFESIEYYEAIEKLNCIIKNEVSSKFSSGPQFLKTFKLLMAKLAVNDFTPLDRQQIDERTFYLKSRLDEAIHYGQTVKPESNKQKEFDLACLDDLTLKLPLITQIELNSLGTVEINDFQIIFKPNQLDCILALYYGELDLQPDNISKWRQGLQKFVSACIDVRFERVRKWIEVNLKKWQNVSAEYDHLIGSLFEDLNSRKVQFCSKYQFCEEKCFQCLLKCSLIANHKDSHSCATSHTCSAKCDFCSDSKMICKMVFGHSGNHVCSNNHTCGAKCRFQDVSGCLGKCQREFGHAGDHNCPENRHPCKKVCSLDGCVGRCVISCEVVHTIHKCFQKQCIKPCSVPGCANKCAALDHFHGHQISAIFANEQQLKREPPFLLGDGNTRFNCDEHFCGLEHQCSEVCQEPGFCKTVSEKTLKNETFIGKRDKFKYGLKFKEIGEKSKCRKKIKPFERCHNGTHECSSEVHVCTTKCPTCENICNKPFGHEHSAKREDQRLHHVRHGNMLKQFFVANQDDIQIGSHKYKVGEPAVAEMCHIFCNTLGRGHIHVVECDSPNPRKCVHRAEDGRRHQTTTYHPNPQVPKDEMTHKSYWESIGFHDPCLDIDQDEFSKCPALCASEVHENEDEESFCELALWHASAKSLSDGYRTTGYVSKDGHLFPCSHPIQTYHFVLCLDDSMSMSGGPWFSLVNAVVKFVKQRCDFSLDDMISIIIHNTRPRVAAEYQPINAFSKKWLRFRGGGNDFSAALWEADCIIGRHLQNDEIPVLVFMSDGSCRNGEAEMYDLCQRYKWDYGLEVYTLGFGPRTLFKKLFQLADIAGGQFIEAVDAMQLRNAFVDIAARYPPSIGVFT